jgi:2-dehydropantoate 2-reductase
MTLKYAVIGTGAIGGYYGARLQQAGCEVHFLLRSDYAAVRQQGLRVDSVNGDFVLPTVNAYSSPSQMPPVDVVLIALKTTHNHQLPNLLPSVNPAGAILSLQNGFAIEQEIAQQLQQDPKTSELSILGGLCFICANKIAPGHIHHLDYGRVLLGAYDKNNYLCPATTLMETIAADFSRANIPIKITPDLPMARWQKLVWNVPYNGLSVVLDATTEEMMADAGVRSLITTLMQEVVTLANAWGAENAAADTPRSLSPDVIAQMLTQTEQMSPYRTSMKIDYDEGRSLEIEAILGNPIRVAQALNIAVPAMTMLYQQLAFLNARNQLRFN